MKTRFIPAIVALLAGAAVSIINIIQKTELIPGLRNLLIVILVFYFIGSIAKVIINRTIEKKEINDGNETDEIESSEETATDDELDTKAKTDEFVK